MPVLGDPPSVPAPDTRTTHGATAPVAYVPTPLKKGGDAGGPAGRPGGRKPAETRPCRVRAGAVPNAAGSAYLEQGRTKIVAAVYGPRQAGERGQNQAEGILMLDVSFAPFCSRFGSKEENGKRAALYTSVLQGALESVVLVDRYGKLAFDISIHVLEDDGGVLTACLAAASLALADAKVELRDLAAGASVHLAAAEGGKPVLLLDCEGQEERSLPPSSAVLHMGFCPARGALCLLHSVGPLPPDAFEQGVLLAKDTAEAVGAELRRCLEERVERRSAKRKLGADAAEAAADADA